MVSRRRERLERGIKVRTDDVYALCSTKEMLYLVAPRLIPILVLLLLPLILPTYWQKVVIFTGVFALLSISWDFLYSFTGLVSLGQALFFGVGAYLAGSLNHYFDISPGLTIPISTIAGATLCTLFLLPALRLRGIYFAMITLVLPLIFLRIIEATAILGGTDGLTALAPLPGIWIELYLILGIMLVALFALRRLVNSDFGLVLRGIHDNDQAVKGAGINIYWYKAQALFIAALLGSFAGAYLTHVYMFVGLSAFALDFTVVPIAATVVGGMGTLGGSVLGAFILVPLSEVLRAFGPLRIVFYALLIVVFIILKPEGLFNYLQRKYREFERWVEV